jgi:hypothetical protein
MGSNDPWIESTADALRARMRRGRPSNGVHRSELLANQHLETCEAVILAGAHGEYAENMAIDR